MPREGRLPAETQRQWADLMAAQQDLIRVYLHAVGRGRTSPEVLQDIKCLVATVAAEVECVRLVLAKHLASRG